MSSRVTVVGCSGDVGGMILPSLQERYVVRAVDLRPPLLFDGEFVEADATDPGEMAAVCADSDVVVYLAMGSKNDWGDPRWARSQFTINVGALYATVRAAAEAGARKFVHASTGSVFEHYEAPDRPEIPDAVDAYGLSKRLGEIVCEAAAREHGIDIVSLRLIGPLPDAVWHEFNEGSLAHVMTAGSDVARAFVSAIDAPLPGYHALFVTGDHNKSTINFSRTTELLGWVPLARRGSSSKELIS